MIYREATPNDSRAIALLHARSWQVHYRGILSDAYLAQGVTDDRLKVWESRLAHPAPNQYVLVAEDAGTLCGLACVYAAHDPVWGSLLDNLHVRPGCQGRGVGTRLLAEAARWAFERAPAVPFYLLVYEQNTQARRFYASQGGTCAETFPVDNPGGGQSPACRYVWQNPILLI
ncbi:MAG TPA: GNAT family N-acetyltransferase [Cytophagales bacterium]|jgi:ribosomal protein S18 acetylase RimI-like enzyme